MKPGDTVVPAIKDKTHDNWRGIVTEVQTKQIINGNTETIVRVSWFSPAGEPSKDVNHYPEELRIGP